MHVMVVSTDDFRFIFTDYDLIKTTNTNCNKDVTIFVSNLCHFHLSRLFDVLPQNFRYFSCIYESFSGG